MPTRALRVRIRGIVQGVGFRYFVWREARVLGLSGFARNRSDGSVEVVAVGEDAAVEQLLERLRAGPPGSRVRDVECETLDAVPAYEAFEITG